MQGTQFWIIMAILALFGWLGVRYFAQTMADAVTSDAGQLITLAVT